MAHGLLSKSKMVNSKGDSHESLGNEKDILQFIHDDPSAWGPSIPGPPILPLENNDEVTPSLTMDSAPSTDDLLFASNSLYDNPNMHWSPSYIPEYENLRPQLPSDIIDLSNFGE